MGTFHAIPVTIWDMFKADAMRVVGGVAAVTQQQDILPLGRVAYGARVALLLLLLCYIFAKPLLDIELGDLFLVLDIVRGNSSA